MRMRLQNLSGNLKSLRDITEHERQKLADDGSLNRAIEAFNREVDQMTAEDQSLLKEPAKRLAKCITTYALTKRRMKSALMETENSSGTPIGMLDRLA